MDAASLRTEPSVVINPANGQRLTYGEIAAFGKVPLAAACGRRRERAQTEEGLAPDRQGRGAARYAGQGQRHGHLRHRRAHSRHGLRDHAALAGAQHRAGQLERRRHQENAGRYRNCEAGERRGGGHRPVRAGAGGAQRAQGDLAKGQGGRLQFGAGAGKGLREDPSRP